MKKMALFMIFLLGLLPVVAFAQDSTEEATPGIPALAGTYDVKQTLSNESQTGTVTIEGTGPVYTVSAKTADGSGGGSTTGLAMGEVLTVAGGPPTCAPASLIRQSDGSLFGQWIDTSVTKTSVGIEFYTPKAATTDFEGSYDLIGTYASGAQYRGTVDISRNSAGIYTLKYQYTADESAPGSVPSSETGTGLANGNVLGYAYAHDNSSSCGALVIKFANDGSFVGEFNATATVVGQASGKPR